MAYIKNEKELADLEGKLEQCSKYQTKNIQLNKKLRYRDNQVAKSKEKVNVLKSEKESLFTEKNRLEKSVNKLTKDLTSSVSTQKQLIKEKKKLLKKLDEIKVKLQSSNVKDIDELDKQYHLLESKVQLLNKENNDLEKLVEILQDDKLVTFADGRFTDETREVIMELVPLNVSINKVNDVIEVVLHTLTNKDVSKIRLPSDGFRKRVMEEARLIAQMQVAEAMLKEGDGVIGNCLHGDGASKYYRHYQNFQVTTKDNKTLSFGLSEMAGGDAASVLKEFTSITDEICYSMSNTSAKDVNFAKLLESIKTTMSDQGPINPLFNAQLKILRESVLPTAIENWVTFDAIKKDELKEMSNYFCKLHLIANFGTETDTHLKEFEQIMLHDDFETNFVFASKKESGAFRHIRRACKVYHKSDVCGVAQCGCHRGTVVGFHSQKWVSPWYSHRISLSEVGVTVVQS